MVLGGQRAPYAVYSMGQLFAFDLLRCVLDGCCKSIESWQDRVRGVVMYLPKTPEAASGCVPQYVEWRASKSKCLFITVFDR